MYDRWLLQKTEEWAQGAVETRGRLEYNPHEFMMWRQAQTPQHE